MATQNSFSDKIALVIDDMPEMRTNLRNQLHTLSITNVSLAASVREGLENIRHKRYDIILCDYHLGGSTDGQQFLEFLRTTNSISRATLFIMVTGETGYDHVITAAECLPDDYLLKPFTGETLKIRLERLLERKKRLSTIDRLQDEGTWLEIIVACDEIIASKDKYVVDALRIKGNALIMSEQIDLAVEFYQRTLAIRDMPWVRLGLARALTLQGHAPQASTLLTSIIEGNPKFLAAYDLLGRIHTDAGNTEEALAILDKACLVAPSSLTRQRSIANLAEDAGDLVRVDKALSTVLRKTKNSPLRDSMDYAKLCNALTELGEIKRAVDTIKEAKDHFRDSGDVQLIASVEAIAQKKAGNHKLASDALALALSNNDLVLPEHINLSIAKACLAHGKSEEAKAILKTVIQNNPDSNSIQNTVAQLLKETGGEEAAQTLYEDAVKEVIQLNNEAIAIAKNGRYAEASKMLNSAALRLPNNMQVVSNAALSLLVDIFINGFDQAKAIQAKQFYQIVQKKNRQHPKLVEIEAFQHKIQAKYKTHTSP